MCQYVNLVRIVLRRMSADSLEFRTIVIWAIECVKERFKVNSNDGDVANSSS